MSFPSHKARTSFAEILEIVRPSDFYGEDRRVAEAAWELHSDPTPSELPTADAPLRGLTHLSKVALLGRDRLVQLAADPVPYVWMDIAVASTIVVIAGAPGEGKTSLLFLVLAARMNTGDPVEVLGRRVAPAPTGKYIVLIEGEHSEGSTARKLIKSMRLLGVDDAALDRVIIIARKAVLLGSPEWSDVVTLIRAGLVSDVALDTLSRVAPADANDEREQVGIFNLIAEGIEAAPAGAEKPIAWLVTHAKKASTGDLSDVSGSTQRTGQADSVLLVKAERSDGRVVSSKVTFAKLREEPEDFPLPVTFSITSTGIEYADAQATDDRPLEPRIIDALRTGPKTKGNLRAILGRNDADLERGITNLFGEKALRTVTIKIRGKDCKAFALRADAAPPAEWDELFQDGIQGSEGA